MRRIMILQILNLSGLTKTDQHPISEFGWRTDFWIAHENREIIAMRWLDTHFKDHLCPDSPALRGNTPEAIAALADTLDGQAMAGLIAGLFRFQKGFAGFLGVGESTVAGWMKAGQVPDHAKRAAVAAVFAGRHWQALTAAREAAVQPKPVRDGDRWLLVRFGTDAAGIETGEILARDIPTERDARLMAGSLRVWALLEEVRQTVLESYLERHDEDDSSADWARDLDDAIGREKALAFDPDGLRQRAAEDRDQAASFTPDQPGEGA
jgi:hypothetical protein